MLNDSVESDDITIDGFSIDIFRNDHPSNNKIGSACLYYREGLPIKRRKDLECLQEMVAAEVIIARKKITFATIYQSPTQTIEQFDCFIDGLESFISCIQAERPYMMMLTGDSITSSAQFPTGLYEIVCRSACEPVVCWCLC